MLASKRELQRNQVNRAINQLMAISRLWQFHACRFFQVKCFVLFDTFGMEFLQAISSLTMINDTSLVKVPRENNYH